MKIDIPLNAQSGVTSPKRQFQIQSYLDLPFRRELNAAVYHVGTISSLSGSLLVQIPSYVRAGMGLQWKLDNRLSLGIWGQNFQSPRHMEDASQSVLSEVPYFNRFDAADLYRITVVAGKPGTLTKLRPSRPLTLSDGMRPLGHGAFLLIEGAGRVDWMVVKGDDVMITTLGEGYVTPTSVTSVGDTAWVSEGQLDFIFDPAKQGQKPRLPFKLFGLAIPK